MKFTVLSHAGLLVRSQEGKTLICDPWLIGSSYWRSWWNYPPVSKSLIDSLIPDVIYITHIHWDHFHGPSLEKFDKNVKIIVPKGNYSRCIDDLHKLGFMNVEELKHGETFTIGRDFSITSYQFGIFLDSAVLIKCDSKKLLNLNDSKHMGLTLKEIVSNHSPIDFVFRSHSSANSRLSYNVVDAPKEEVDDITSYIENFAATVNATGARYAIPFASNHCHLHKDTWDFNKYIQTPYMVKEYFDRNDIQTPECVIMATGDSYDDANGFSITSKEWFEDREKKLLEYRDSQQEKLLNFYKEEDNTRLKIKLAEKYFKDLSGKIPFFLKNPLHKPFTYVLYTFDKPTYVLDVNIAKGTVVQLDPREVNLDNYTEYPLQIHTTLFIFQRCLAFRIFSHMSIGKRVFYRVTKASKPSMELLNLVFNLEEYDMLPLSRNFKGRSIETWLLRWREILLYFGLAKDKVLTGKMDFNKYLRPVKH